MYKFFEYDFPLGMRGKSFLQKYEKRIAIYVSIVMILFSCVFYCMSWYAIKLEFEKDAVVASIIFGVVFTYWGVFKCKHISRYLLEVYCKIKIERDYRNEIINKLFYFKEKHSALHGESYKVVANSLLHKFYRNQIEYLKYISRIIDGYSEGSSFDSELSMLNSKIRCNKEQFTHLTEESTDHNCSIDEVVYIIQYTERKRQIMNNIFIVITLIAAFIIFK